MLLQGDATDRAAMLRAAWPVRRRQPVLPGVSSSTQCRLFSTPQLAPRTRLAMKVLAPGHGQVVRPRTVRSATMRTVQPSASQR